MLVTREDPGNAASTSSLVSNLASTPSYVGYVVGHSALAAPFVGLRGVTKHVANCSVENNGEVCGVHGMVWSLGPTMP